MSLWRGIQSAIFHYISCAPCTGYSNRKRRRKEARRDKLLRQKLQLEQPEQYCHPDPSGTNVYWQEEIILGPGPPPRRVGRRGTKANRTGTNLTCNSFSGGSSLEKVDGADGQNVSDETLDGDNWNRRRYQREDEDLWGHERWRREPHSMYQHKCHGGGSSVGLPTGVSRPGTSHSTSTRDSNYCYYVARAPPVNDLHPPVVSMPSSNPADNRWMLQPPPCAKIMNGIERATSRSSSSSTASSRMASGANSRVRLDSLQRQISARRLYQKIQGPEMQNLAVPQTSTTPSRSTSIQSQPRSSDDTPNVIGLHPHSSMTIRRSTQSSSRRTSTSKKSISPASSTTDLATASATPSALPTTANQSPSVLKPAPTPLSLVNSSHNARPELTTILSSGFSSPLTKDSTKRDQGQPNPDQENTPPSMTTGQPQQQQHLSPHPNEVFLHPMAELRKSPSPLTLPATLLADIQKDGTTKTPVQPSKKDSQQQLSSSPSSTIFYTDDVRNVHAGDRGDRSGEARTRPWRWSLDL